jgi:hypothetical protein
MLSAEYAVAEEMLITTSMIKNRTDLMLALNTTLAPYLLTANPADLPYILMSNVYIALPLI